MAHSLSHREVCVVELHVLTYETYAYLLLAGLYAIHHIFPFYKVRRRRVNAKLPADDLGKVRLLQHQRRLVKAW